MKKKRKPTALEKSDQLRHLADKERALAAREDHLRALHGYDAGVAAGYEAGFMAGAAYAVGPQSRKEARAFPMGLPPLDLSAWEQICTTESDAQ